MGEIARYSGLIKCKKCGKNFKVKKERGKVKYLCRGYDTYGSEFCSREVLREDVLNDLMELHFREKLDKFEVRNYIDRMEIYSDKWIFTFTDGSQMIRTRNFLQI